MRGEKSGGDSLWLGPRKRRGANRSGLELDSFELKSLVWRACHASRDTPPPPLGRRNCREPGLFFTAAWGWSSACLRPSGFALGDSLQYPLLFVRDVDDPVSEIQT